MRIFSRIYGGRPRHLIAVLLAGAFAAYGWTRIVQHGHARDVVIWFVGAILAHDLILFPLYRLIYAIASRAGHVQKSPRSRVSILQHIVFPAAASGLLLLIWLPLIVHPGKSAHTYQAITSVSSHPYLARWELITAGLFLASGLTYAVRTARAPVNGR